MSDQRGGRDSIYDLHKTQSAAKHKPAVQFIQELCKNREYEVEIYCVDAFVDRFMKYVSTNVTVVGQVPRGYLPGTVHVTAKHRIIARTDFSGSFSSHMLW